MPIEIKPDIGIYERQSNGEFICTHQGAEVVMRCCPTPVYGNVECGCAGMDAVICPNPNCTGLTEEDANKLLGKEL